MEYINFGRVVNVSTSVPTAIDDSTYHIIIDFVPDDPNIFDDFNDGMAEILKRPDNYVLCDIDDIVKAQDEIQKLREQLIKERSNSDLKKENQALRDRVKELVDQLTDAKKKVEELQKLGDYWKGESDAMARNYRRLKKKLDDMESKTVAEVRYELNPNGFTLIYTMCDGSKQMIGMDLADCGTVPKCSSCAHYMHNPSRFAHDWCYMPIPKEGGAGYIRMLNKEESEGPACKEFVARKE